MRPLPLQGPDRDEVLAAMASVPLLAPMTAGHHAQLVDKAELLEVETGEAIITAGEASDSFYLLLHGRAAVMVDNPACDSMVEVARLGPGESIGEMGLLLDQRRSATVVARETSRVVKFTAKLFHYLFDKAPGFGLETCRGLARRVQETSGLVPCPECDGSHADPAALRLLPAEFLARHRVLPIELVGNQLELGFVGDPSARVIDAVKRILPGIEPTSVRIEESLFEEKMSTLAGDRTWSEPEVDDGSPPVLEPLLRRMVAEGASDLHLSAGHRPRWRIDGEMKEMADARFLGDETVLDLLMSAMDERAQSEFAATGDADFAHSVPGLARFRVNLFRDARGIGAVLRQIPDKVLSIEQLGLPDILQRFCNLPKGLVLVTGPTGSGKSTTLAAMIDHINHSRPMHIITLEDPIEFAHASDRCLVNQREVGNHTESFGRALRAALREDPDIVLVGELRDLETIALALEVANTGHLVFGTLHTSTAISTIDRIIDVFPAEQQPQIRAGMADSLKAVVAQTLCKRIGGGRVAAIEILVVNNAVANLMREGRTPQIISMMQTGKQFGNRLLNDELFRLVQEGLVDTDEAINRAIDKPDLERRLG